MKLIPKEWEPHVLDKEYLLSLINPQFVKKEGLIVVKSHYDPKTFKANWIPIIQDHPDDIAKIENTLNHIHLGDLTENIEMQKKIGEQLSKIWRNKLKSQFPNFRFETKLEFKNDEWELQLWTVRNPKALRPNKSQETCPKRQMMTEGLESACPIFPNC